MYATILSVTFFAHVRWKVGLKVINTV